MARRAVKADRSRLKALGKVAANFEGWAPAREVLTPVRAVPTIFPMFDVATRVGGCPLQRVITLHGPSNHGKTTMAHGLGLSFLRHDNFYALIDAEHTTPEDWILKLMGEQMASHPGFLAKRPHDYEEVRADVKAMLTMIMAEVAAENLPADVATLVAVDSIRKLVPKGILDKLMKDEGGVDGMGGRAGQIKAAHNAAWMDEMVPLLHDSNASLLLIARESENSAKKGIYDIDYKIGGGTAIIFDSSLLIRVERAAWVAINKTKKNPGGTIIGERHRFTISKTKVGGKEGKTTRGYFHTSNGVSNPEGFDLPRDLIEMGKGCGRFKVGGSWITDQQTGEKWNGTEKAVSALHALTPGQLDVYRRELLDACSPEEVDDEADS